MKVKTEDGPISALNRIIDDQESIQIIMVDYNMPGMNGLEFTNRIRCWEKDTNRPHIPILMCSGNSGDIYIEE